MKNEGSRWHCRAVIQAVAVLRYLIKNPDAKDTIEGVCRWWLSEGYREQEQEELEKILDSFVEKHWLTTRTTPQQENIYGLNKNFLEQIKSYLNNADVDE